MTTKTEDFEKLMGEFKRFRGIMKQKGFTSFEAFMEHLDATSTEEQEDTDAGEDKPGTKDKAETDEGAEDEAATEAEELKLVEDAVAEFLVTGEISEDTHNEFVERLKAAGVDAKLAPSIIKQTFETHLEEFGKLETKLQKELGDSFKLAEHVIWANENMADIDALKPRLDNGDINAFRILQADMADWVTENPKDADTFRDRFSDAKAIRSKEGETKAEETIEANPAVEQVQESVTVAVTGNEEPEFRTGRVMAEEPTTPATPVIKPYEDINEFDMDTQSPNADTPPAIAKRKARLEVSSAELQRELEFTPDSGLQTETASAPKPGDQS